MQIQNNLKKTVFKIMKDDEFFFSYYDLYTMNYGLWTSVWTMNYMNYKR